MATLSVRMTVGVCTGCTHLTSPHLTLCALSPCSVSVTALIPPLCFIFNLNEMFCFSCYLPVINLIGNSVSGHGLSKRICVELKSTSVVCPICPGVTDNQPFMFYILKDIFELINKDGVKAQVCVVPTW